MLKILYVAYFGLSVVNSAQFALEMCLTAQTRQKIHTNPYFDVQDHPRSLLLVAIKRPCMTSY